MVCWRAGYGTHTQWHTFCDGGLSGGTVSNAVAIDGLGDVEKVDHVRKPVCHTDVVGAPAAIIISLGAHCDPC